MKVYIARYFESSKGLSVEGIRYKRLNDKFVGVYCSYFIKSDLYRLDLIKKAVSDMKPVNVSYSEEKKSYLIYEN